MSTRLLIVSDVRLFADGLRVCLAQHAPIEVVDTSMSGEHALDSVRTWRPDVMLIDVTMADSLATIRATSELGFPLKVVALAVSETDDNIVACVEAGVAGYVPRDASLDHLVAVVESVARDELLCPPRVAGTLMRRLASLASGQVSGGVPLSALTGREQAVARLVGVGFSNKEIARRLSIEVATVKNHVHNILEKLRIHRRGEIAVSLSRLGGRPSSSRSERRQVGGTESLGL